MSDEIWNGEPIKRPPPPFELMYKQPGAAEHQNITEALDEIILTLRELDIRVRQIEEWCDQVTALVQPLPDN